MFGFVDNLIPNVSLSLKVSACCLKSENNQKNRLVVFWFDAYVTTEEQISLLQHNEYGVL